MEKLLPEHYSIARGKVNISMKVTKTPWVLKWWEKLQWMKKGTDFVISLKLLVITAFEISIKLLFTSKINISLICVYATDLETSLILVKNCLNFWFSSV